MTDQVLQSNNSSVIFRSLQDAEVQDLSYTTKPSYPILAKDKREIQSNQAIAGSPHGQEVSFNLIKSKLWTGAMIKTAYTISSTYSDVTSNSDFHGLNMFEWVQIRSNNKVIFQMTDSYLQGRTSNEKEHKQGMIQRMALPLVPTTELPANLGATTSLVTYTPIFSSFFESVKNALDLNFLEQLTVVVKFNTQSRAGFQRDITAATCTLWDAKYVLDDKAYDMLRAKNFSPSRPLNFLAYSVFQESIECTGLFTNSIRLNVNFPVFKTYIMLRNKTATIEVGGQPFKIDSFDFSVGGTKLLENVPYLVGVSECAYKGASSLVVSGANTVVRSDKNAICLDWGMDMMQDRTYNSGGISFNQISFPQVTVNHQTLTDASHYDLIVVHEYWQILTMDGANGSINVSVNS
jgi:hypothetical protein